MFFTNHLVMNLSLFDHILYGGVFIIEVQALRPSVLGGARVPNFAVDGF